MKYNERELSFEGIHFAVYHFATNTLKIDRDSATGGNLRITHGHTFSMVSEICVEFLGGVGIFAKSVWNYQTAQTLKKCDFGK